MRFKLDFGDFTFTDADTMGGVTWKREINSGDDFTYGTAAMAEVKFAILADALPNGTVLDDLPFDLYISQAESGNAVWEDYGIYTVKTVVKSGHKLEVTAYDNMSKFDIIVDEWLSTLTYPLSVSAMLGHLCNHCGVQLGNASLANSNYSIEENFWASGITGRQVLAFIAEMTAAFAFIQRGDGRGRLSLKQLSNSNVQLDRSMYRTAKIAEYAVLPVDKVQIRVSENDVGVVYGTGDNAYIIENNPLLYTSSAASLDPVAIELYNLLSAVTYTPATVELFRDYGIDTGQYYTINGVKSLVMSKTMKPGGVTLTCSGTAKRSQTVSGGSYELMMLRGRSNVFERTLEKTLSRITDAEGSITTLEQTASSITARIEDAEGNISTLEQTVNGFETRITNAEGDASDALATAEALVFRVSSAEGDITALEQTANGLLSRVSTAEGNISTVSQTANKVNWLIKSGTSSSNFTLTDRAISLVAGNIDLTGYVTFSALSTAGQTTINGSNITTGSISASRIGANNGSYITFGSPIYMSTTYPQIYGLDAIYFNGTSRNCVIYGNNENIGLNVVQIRATGGLYYHNGTYNYPIVHSGNIASYVTFQ